MSTVEAHGLLKLTRCTPGSHHCLGHRITRFGSEVPVCLRGCSTYTQPFLQFTLNHLCQWVPEEGSIVGYLSFPMRHSFAGSSRMPSALQPGKVPLLALPRVAAALQRTPYCVSGFGVASPRHTNPPCAAEPH